MNPVEEFLKYVDKYDNNDKEILLKRRHTLRVMELSEEIAKSLDLSEEDVELAKLCGLLHDIGRFTQIRDFNTYNDLVSLDHGDLGAEILKKDNYINKFTNKNQDNIIKVVKYHNKYRIPKTLSEKNRLLTKIVRDADKIDILFLFVNKETHNHIEYTSVSKEVYNDILNKRLVRNINVKTSADEIVREIANIFDISYKKSFEIIKERDYVNKIFKIQLERTKNEEFIKQLKEMQLMLNNYIEEMLEC